MTEAYSAPIDSASFGLDEDDVVVVIGSGAGGGTVASELCGQGIRTVVLEAGPHLTGPDYENDEWPAFNQMAWLDNRTTSGSWRVARDFPNLPAWPLTLEELEPYYDRAERKIGSTHRHGRPPLPANNNYKVFANGADRVGYTGYATGPYGTNAEPYDGRPGSIQDGFNFQGDKHGSKWSTLVSDLPKAGRTGNLDLRPNCQAVQITHDAGGRADGCCTWTPTRTCTASARGSCASPATRSRRRGCCCSRRRRYTRTVLRTRRGRSGATTCAT